MNEIRRVVFDTSTLVGAALRPASAADRAFSLALRSGVICACEQTLEQLRSLLARKALDRYMSKRARLSFVDFLCRNAWICPVLPSDIVAVRPACRDRRNNIVLALATTAEAGAIISTEPDLLTRKFWRKIPVVTPAGFLSESGQE